MMKKIWHKSWLKWHNYNLNNLVKFVDRYPMRDQRYMETVSYMYYLEKKIEQHSHKLYG